MPIPCGDSPSTSQPSRFMLITPGGGYHTSHKSFMSIPCGDVPPTSQRGRHMLVLCGDAVPTLKHGISTSRMSGDGSYLYHNGRCMSISMCIPNGDAPTTSQYGRCMSMPRDDLSSTSHNGRSISIQSGDAPSTLLHGMSMPIPCGNPQSILQHDMSMSISSGNTLFKSRHGILMPMPCENTLSTSHHGRYMCKPRRGTLSTSQHWRTMSILSANALTIQKSGLLLEFSSLDEAFDALRGSEQLLSLSSLFWTLEMCSKSKNLENAMYIYLHLCNCGLENHRCLVNHIVPMFVECGSVFSAEHAIFRSMDCNEYSWTSLIQGFIECGQLQHALSLYDKMQQDQIHPSKYTYMILLKAFGRQNCVERSLQLHTEIVTRGLETETFVGNSLVRMYSRHSALQEARKVFDKILTRDIVSWNSLLVGYCEVGLTGEALEFLEWMQSQGTSPDHITYTCCIRACGSRGSITNGQHLHTDVIKKGFEHDDIVSSTLVDMYAKCGALEESHYLFVQLSVHDTISCNSMMVGCVEQGHFQKALNLLDAMEKYNISADCSTYACSLKACGTMKTLDNGRKIHIEILKKGYESDDYVGSTLVAMYSKCGVFVEAHKVFNKMPIRDLVTWTALISGLTEYGHADEALVCFDAMQLDGICPCELLFSNALKACSSIEALDKGRELHAEIAKKGFERDSFIGSIMVDMYANCGSLIEARHVFEKFVVRDTVLWSSLISGYVEYGFAEEALEFLEYMRTEEVFLDATVFACALKACGAIGAMERGQEIHSEIIAKGFEHDQTVSTILIDMYAKCGVLLDAKMVFDKHSSRDVVSWNTIISAYASHGFSEKALYLFQQMQILRIPIDAISWSSVILGYADNKKGSKMAFTCFLQMQEQAMLPNDIILLSILKACGDTSCLDAGRRIHAQICHVDGGLVFNQLNLTTTIIEMYGKCGDMAYAQELLDATKPRNVSMWDALIRGYARQMEFVLVFSSLKRMRAEGIQPDGILFLNILNVCSHLSLISTAENIFQAMIEDFCISPTIKHYTCMVDLLGRAGRLHEAVVMIEKTCSLQANSVVWCMVLDACRKWKNIEVGRLAFDRAVRGLKEQGCAPFILMSSIYADAGRYDEAKMIKSMM